MAPPTNEELNAKREEHCLAVTHERKYYRVGQTWIKRSLRPSEWQKHNGYMPIPLFNLERVLNEGACLRFLAQNTDIPLPKLHACFEDDGAAYLITEYVQGIGMNELDDAKRGIVAKELQAHMDTMSRLKSNIWGGPSGLVRLSPINSTRQRIDIRTGHASVPCHEKIQWSAVADEAAGYAGSRLLPEFEVAFFRRPGPSVALEGEADDADLLMDIMSKEKL